MVETTNPPGAGALRDEGPQSPEPRAVEAIRRLLLAWYDVGKRDLPWRGESDPYRIWVSEVMLQQTRVETVIPYYKKWVDRFPDLEVLAGAGEEEVVGVWEGLGYYSRARRLLGAARVVRERYGGALPGSAEGLLALPGVGEYTAGAVASIAFGEVVPAVDGNVKRVLARLFDLPDPGARVLRALAGALVDPARPGEFNQALMELGARLCIPRSPWCGSCPLGGHCLALARGTVARRPARREKRPVREVEVAVVVPVRDQRLLLRRRPPRGLLAGMWEFPGEEMGKGEDPEGAAKGVLDALGQESDGALSRLPMVRHAFTHLRVRYHPFLCPVSRGRAPAEGRWVSLREAGDLALPVAQRKILGMARGALGRDG